MAASARDLLAAVRHRALLERPEEASAIAAMHAVGHLARIPRMFAGREPTSSDRAAMRRYFAAQGLAVEGARVGTAWPLQAGRLPDLAGVAADAIAIELPHRGEQERWAAVVEAADAVGACAELARGFTPFATIPPLIRVQRLATVVSQIAAHTASVPGDEAWLERPIAARPGPQAEHLDPAAQAVESAAQVIRVAALRHREGNLTVRQLLVAAAGAEACCRGIARMAGPSPQLAGRAESAGDSWQVVTAALIRFDDGGYRTADADTRIFNAARSLQRQFAILTADTVPGGSGAESAALPFRTARAAQYIANQLPELARLSAAAITDSVRRRRVLARARNLPYGTQTATALVRDQVVIVEPGHIVPSLVPIRIAQRLSTALAVELDRALPDAQPNPTLARAHRNDVSPNTVELDAARSRHLAARANALVPDHRASLA